MVEGAAGLVVFPRSTDDVAACVRAAAVHDLAIVPRGSGTGLAGASTPIGDALVVVTSKMNRILEVRPEDRLAWVEPGLFNLDLGDALRARDSRTCRTRPRSRCRRSAATWARTPAARTAWPTASRPRTSWRSTSCSRTGPWRASAREGPEAAGYDLRGVVVGSEGTVGLVAAACVRLTPRAAGDHDDAAGLRHGRGLRGDGLRHHRARSGARGAGDDGSGDRPRRGVVRPRRLPDGCRGRAARRGGRHPRGVDAEEREVEAAARDHAVGTIRVAETPRGTRAPVEGAEVGVRRDRPDRAPLPPPRLRRAAHEARRGAHGRLRDLPSGGHHGHERVPRRRREPASAALLRQDRARECSNACCGPRRRSCASAWTPVARSPASTASGSRSGTSCRSCSPRTTSRRRRACGARSIPGAG